MRKFQIGETILAAILQKGENLGFFKFKDSDTKQGVTHLALEIEKHLQEREQYVLDRIVAELKK